MAELGEVAYDLGLAWLTAWAFQLLVIVMPAERERKRLEAVVAPRLDHLIDLGTELADAVANQAGTRPGPLVVGDAITTVCAGTGLSAEAPGWATNWGGLLRHLSGRAAEVRASLRPFYPRLPPELLEALEEEDQAMESIARMERFGRTFNATDMKRLESPIFRWLTSVEMVRELRSSTIAPDRPLPARSALEAGMVHVPMDDFIKQREELERSLGLD